MYLKKKVGVMILEDGTGAELTKISQGDKNGYKLIQDIKLSQIRRRIASLPRILILKERKRILPSFQ